MSVLRLLGALTISWLCSISVRAQLPVSSPVPRMVFQRNTANQASVLVAGLAPPTATTVEARFVPLTTGQGTLTPWTPLAFLPTTKAFRGSVTVSAGWYRLDVRAKNDAAVLNLTSVNRVGVGEVFVLAGQSNVVGGFERVPGAIDDRVSCVDFRQDSLSEQLLPLRFSHVSYGSNIGPSQPPHIWGMLGDSLVRRLNVPVLFLGAALGGTSSEQWRQSAAGTIGAAQNDAVYRRLGVVLLHYIARTGARAVLWHQGESDLSTSNQTYFDNIRLVIEKSRQQTGYALPWVMSRASYIGGQTNPNVIAAQNRLIAELPAVFPGPATDDLLGPDNRRDDNVHFGGNGLRRFTDRWNQSLSSNFLAQSVPFTPTNGASLLTSGYTLPLARRPGETVVAASVRSNPQASDSQFFAQLVRGSDGATVAESGLTTDNPILFTLPNNLPDGQYQLRTVATHPPLTGTLGEVFVVNAFAPATPPQTALRPVETAGTADPTIQRIGYRYEPTSHSFFAMVQATEPVEVRLERVDGGGFDNSAWYVAPPASQAPDYAEFADFNFIRNYPPVMLAVGGVPPGRYRLSVRKQGDGGSGVSFTSTLLNYRNILYQTVEPVVNVPPVPDGADLSLTMRSDTRTSAVGQPVRLTLTLTNSGPDDASAVQVQSLLPPNVTFVDGATDISSSGDAVTVGPVDVAAGDSRSFAFRVRPNQPGRYVVAAQVTVSSVPDPDSQPNSGTEDGQDDAVQLDLRTPDAGSALFVSPNPNQTPLPPVQTNQPPTDSNTADLSLAIVSDRLVAEPGQTVSLSLIVSNRGGASASNVSVNALLPTGWQVINGAGLIINGQTVAGTLPAIQAGSSATLGLLVRANTSGTVQAQIQTASPTDPDSTPGNGYTNGEDDEASVSVRVL